MVKTCLGTYMRCPLIVLTLYGINHINFIRVDKVPHSVMGQKSEQIADAGTFPNSDYICLCYLFHLVVPYFVSQHK